MSTKTGQKPFDRLFVLLPILSGAGWGVAGVFVRIFSAAGLDNPTIVFTRTAVCALLTFLYILIQDLRVRQRPAAGKAGAELAVAGQAEATEAAAGQAGAGKAAAELAAAKQAEAAAWQVGAGQAEATEAAAGRVGAGQAEATEAAAWRVGAGQAEATEAAAGQAGAGRVPSVSLLYMRLRDMPIVLASAVFGSVVLMIAYNIAIASLSLSLAAILLCTAPIFVLLISTVVFREKITRKKVLCMALAIFGCGLLSGVFSGGGLQWSVFGLLMGVAASLCNAVFIIMSKLIATKGYSSFTVSFYASLFASLILLAFVDWGDLLGYLAVSPLTGPLLILVQSICTSLLPSLIYIVAMRHVEAGRVAILQAGAEPAAAFLAGLLLYAEVPTAMGLAGMVITIIALMILAGGRE